MKSLLYRHKWLCFFGIFSALVAVTGCSSDSDDPDAQIPRITAISADVTTVVHVAKELSVGVEISDAGKLSYQWYAAESKLSAGEAVSDAVKPKFSPETAEVGTFFYYCVITNQLGSSKRSVTSPRVTYTVTESVYALQPTIAKQPENISADFGTECTLETIAFASDDGTLSYQWYMSPDSETEPTAISSATASTYRLSISAETLGYYYCEITNAIEDNGDGGNKTARARTTTAIISCNQINAPVPVILQHPQNVTAEFQQEFVLSVLVYTSEEVTTTYQWFYKNADEEPVAIENATQSKYTGTVSAATVGQYYCEITNTIEDNSDGGQKSATAKTNTAIISNNTTYANEPIILTRLEDKDASVPDEILFSVSAYSSDGGTLSYQWYKIVDKTETVIEGATGSEYAFTAQEVGVAQYYCAVTNTIQDNGDGGNKSAQSKTNTATVTVSVVNAETPTITLQPLDSSAVIPAIKVFSASAYVTDGGDLSYQWYSLTEDAPEGKPVEDATGTTPTLKLKVEELGRAGYYCVITNTIQDNGDGGKKTAKITSDTAWLDVVYLKDVVSAPEFVTQPIAMSIAPYNQSIELSCAAESADGTVSYRWYKSADGTTATGTAVSGANTATFTTPLYTEKGIYYYYCVATNLLSADDGEDIKSAAAISTVVSVAYTGLPTVYFDLNIPVASITKTEYVQGSMKIISESYKDFSYDFTLEKEGVKGRGNSSWGQPKKGYNIKFDKKQTLFGLPKAKKWCIIANYSDKTLLRNKFASILGTELYNTVWNPSFIPVDVVMNGEYQGNYIFCEKITLTDGRIEVQDIVDVDDNLAAGKESKVDDANGDGVKDLADGGFILEIDSRKDADFYFTTTHGGQPFTLKDPDDVSQDVFERVQNVVQTAEDALYGADFADSEIGWRKYIDEDSMVDWFIVNEFAKNNDAIFYTSVYLYYNPANEKLYMGPNWDFDIGFGNVNYNGCDASTGWWIKNAKWISLMVKDPAFVKKVKSRWNEKKSDLYTAVNTQIQSLADTGNISADYNFMKWKILGTYVWPNPAGYAERTTYQSEVNYMINWLNERYTWLDGAINGL